MKTKFLTLAALGAATAIGQAFTIDFNALEVPFGTIVDSATPLTVTVAGYGDVRFEVPPTVVIEVDSNYQNDGGTIQNSLELDSTDVVLVTFLGPTALNVDFDIIGVNSGESASATYFPLSDDYQYAPGGSGDGAGIAAISWTVPEPSSSLLVLVGAGSLILRRRRG